MAGEGNEEEKAGWSRRGFLKAGAVIGGMALIGAHKAGEAAVPFEENPLVGCYDWHLHSGPDTAPRCLNDIDTARKAREMGMRGFNLYNHQTMTLDRAYLVRQVVPGIEVFGGITLNYPIGGINPAAVETALKFTGDCMRFVKLPTQAAAHDLAAKAKEHGTKWDGRGLRIYDSSGTVLPEVRRILKMVAKADIAMLTGHISPDEDLAVVKAAREDGVRKMVITHAMAADQNVPLETMKRLADMGAFIEHVYLNYHYKQASLEQYVKAIREVGAERTIVGTDLGQAMNPIPTDGLKTFILDLMKGDITRQEIDLMTKRNPARLAGLEPF